MVMMNTTNTVHFANYLGREIEVTRLWKTSDIVAFANSVASSCIIDGMYYPATFDYSFKYYLICYTTDFELPSDEDELEKCVMNSDLFSALEYDPEWLYYMEEICRETIDGQLRAIERSALSKIAQFGDSIVDMIDTFLGAAQNWKLPENFGETVAEIHELAHNPSKIAEIYNASQEIGGVVTNDQND
jgi:hypothetical protein